MAEKEEPIHQYHHDGPVVTRLDGGPTPYQLAISQRAEDAAAATTRSDPKEQPVRMIIDPPLEEYPKPTVGILTDPEAGYLPQVPDTEPLILDGPDFVDRLLPMTEKKEPEKKPK